MGMGGQGDGANGRGGGGPSDPRLRVVDRRRFGPEGEPRSEDPSPPEPAVPESAPPDPGRAALAQAARVDELTRAYAALQDDNRAFRQRLEREKERVVAAERAKVAQALLEAHDELELAWNASRSAAGSESPALRDLREGVRLTLQGLASRVAGLGAERIEVLGKAFDPATAEAVDLVTVADAAQEGLVVGEIRPGWRLGDRILRPARVRVGRLARA